MTTYVRRRPYDQKAEDKTVVAADNKHCVPTCGQGQTVSSAHTYQVSAIESVWGLGGQELMQALVTHLSEHFPLSRENGATAATLHITAVQVCRECLAHSALAKRKSGGQEQTEKEDKL